VIRRLPIVVAVVLVLGAAAACGTTSGGSSAATGSAPGSTGAATTTVPSGPLTGATAPPTLLGGSGPLAKTRVYAGLSRNHVDGPIRYRQTPPVGGDHNPVWQTCGYYSSPVNTPNGVHSLEHGAVWITYRPGLPAPQQAVLRAIVTDHPYVLITPWADGSLPSPVVLSAWGVQLDAPSATSPAVAAFVREFERGPQTPEQGVPCAGGVGSPDVQSRAPAGN